MLRLTLINKSDLLFVNEVRNDCAELYLHDSRKFTIEETVNWYMTTNPKFWIIWNEDVRIGYFRTSNHSIEDKTIYVGADIHKDYRGKGLGYKSYCKFLPCLFNYYDIESVLLEVLGTNKSAIALYEKLGFREIEVKKNDVLKNGVWVDSIVMSVDFDHLNLEA